MNASRRAMACGVLGLLFVKALAQSAENYLRFVCRLDDQMPGCWLDVGVLTLSWNPGLVRIMLLLWILGAAVVAAGLMAVWQRRPSRGRPDGVTLCVFGMGLMVAASLVNFAVMQAVFRSRFVGDAEGFNAGLWVPVFTSLLTAVGAVGLWRMQAWGRSFTVVLAVSLASLTVFNLVQFHDRLSAGGTAAYLPVLATMLLAALQWSVIAGYLLQPSVACRFQPAR